MEKLGQPIVFPLRTKKKWCFIVNYWGGPASSFPTLKSETSTLCRWLSGWRKTGPAHSFPTQTSESINLTQSGICIQPLLFLGGGEKLGRPILFPVWEDKASTLCSYLGGEKLSWSILFPPWQVKASTLPCHEYTFNLCFLGGGKKLGWLILSPPWLVKVSILCRS